MRSGDVVTRTHRVDSLPGVVVTGRTSLSLILLGGSKLMPGVRGDDVPSMDEFVTHAGLVAAFPRPAGPRTGEEDLDVIQAGRVEACPLPACPRGGEDEDLVVVVSEDELVLEGGVQLTWMMFVPVFPRAIPVPGTFQGWHSMGTRGRRGRRTSRSGPSPALSPRF